MEQQQAWIRFLKTHQLADTALWALDTFAPFAPLIAQGLWVLHPLSRVLGGEQPISDIAHALETPEGVAQLRRVLDDNHKP